MPPENPAVRDLIFGIVDRKIKKHGKNTKLYFDLICKDTLYLSDTGQRPKPSASSTLENSLLIKLSSLKKKNIQGVPKKTRISENV